MPSRSIVERCPHPIKLPELPDLSVNSLEALRSSSTELATAVLEDDVGFGVTGRGATPGLNVWILSGGA